MRCQRIKENLVKYLAGECLPGEKQHIESHLSECARCSAEKAELELLDEVLDCWTTGPPRGDVKDGIMSAIKIEQAPGNRNTSTGSKSNQAFLRGLLKDLVAAAAVTLVLFGVGGSWLSPGSFDAFGESVNGVARSYTNITNHTVERLVSAADTYTGKITAKEWDLDDMYKSR